jgi:hypothetical protein
MICTSAVDMLVIMGNKDGKKKSRTLSKNVKIYFISCPFQEVLTT